MLFANDIVLIDEIKRGISSKLEQRKEALETKGFKARRTKTEYMECKFSNKSIDNTMVKLEEKEILKSDHFC